MRFPIDPPQAVGVAEDLYEVQESAAIRAARAIGTTPSPLALEQRHRPPVAPLPQREAGTDTRTNGDRRQGDRRREAVPVLVDTRLGRDRRKTRRRPDDPPPLGIEEKV